MSLPQQKINSGKSGKHRAAAMKEPEQHSGEVYYGMGVPPLESGHSDSGGSSSLYIPEKGPQSRAHHQQGAPVRWMHQDPIQAPGWSQEAPVPAWGQNFGPPYMGGGNNVRGQMVFPKGGHDAGALQTGEENQPSGSVEVYREATQAQAQARGLEWEQHAAAALRQAQLQAYQPGHKCVDPQGQPHAPSHTMPGSMLQPFHSAFGPKQQLPSGYFPVFQGSKGMPSLGYSEQPKTQHQLLQQMQQHQMHQQQQQQQQLHQQQHHHQLQQQQHLQQQHHQMQRHQIQQQQLQQMQQYHHQQQLQEQRQQIQLQQQQQQTPNVPQQETPQPQLQQKQQQNQHFLTYQSPEPCPSNTNTQKENVQSVASLGQQKEAEIQPSDTSAVPDPCTQKVSSSPTEPSDAQQVLPRRSRRLSRDGLSPLGGPPTTTPWSQAFREPLPAQNGVAEVEAGEAHVTTGGVIQSTRRRRRASKEINLETLAQKASEMESLPAKAAKQEDVPLGRPAGMMPLVIPVSVPVRGGQTDPPSASPQGRLDQHEQLPAQPEHKASVIVARRRSLRNSTSESSSQEGDGYAGQDDDGKSKSKRRPRPEPLFIPPPKPATFIAPSVYTSITPYQSHLRSPIRLPDHPFILPPYTPPPILSPVREGSGLYFSTFLSNIAASSQSLPPPATPKSATRSLLRATSSDITPPVLPLITDATPVSFEPRINIGLQYQAEVPELRDCLASQFDQHKADLVWFPVKESQLKHGDEERELGHISRDTEHVVDDLMSLACSSVFHGGGTNQELVLHCLHESSGDVPETLKLLMLKEPIFSKGHHLADYHYSGSDRWTAEEKCYFNKGITAYRKDFFMVQKLVRTKTVAQCVEFYYAYKKQVKMSRNGGLTYGPLDSPVEKTTGAVVNIKSSHQSKCNQGEGERLDSKVEDSHNQSKYDHQAKVTHTLLQTHDYAAARPVHKTQDAVNKETHPQSMLPFAPHKPRPESTGKKSRAPAKPPQDPEGVFPCKKCSRVFYKVKSRSAHMKSHSEQEKKAAALRQREEEERVAAAARAQAREAAEAALNCNRNKATERTEASSHDESPSEAEDEGDEDWR